MNHPESAVMPQRQMLRWMFAFLRPVRFRVVLACTYLALWVGAEAFAVKQTADVVNEIQQIHASGGIGTSGFFTWVRSDDLDAQRLRRIVLTLAAIGAAMGVLTYLREVANSKLSMNMVYYIREAVYDKLQQVGFAFHDRLSTGELINRSLTDLQNVRQFVHTAVLSSLEIGLIVTAYLVLLLTRSPWVAALAVVPLPLWCWYILRFSRRVQPAQQAVMEAGDRNVSRIAESIAGVHVIRGFGTESLVIADYQRNCNEFFARVMRRVAMFANFHPVVRLIASASHLMLFLAGAILMSRGRLQPGDLLMLGAAMGAILHRLQQVALINDQYQSAIVSSRRLREVLAAEPTVRWRPDARPLPPGPGEVVFDSVTFGYDPNTPVIRDVSFTVRGGSTVAIVGPVGAGKTTLTALLARFYDPQSGRVLIDGTDIREVSASGLRSHVGMVAQETYLFSDSVSANVAYSEPLATEEDIRAACEIAQAHEFVSALPRGYDTPLGERGATLSGGQRQRLAIARALVSNPRILVLDDATAAIDPETEDVVHRGVHAAMAGRTIFVIAHRVSTVRRADLVLVLQAGRLTQIGSHVELLAQPGYYRDIALAQLEQFEHLRGSAESPSHTDRVVAGDAAPARTADSAAPPGREGGS